MTGFVERKTEVLGARAPSSAAAGVLAPGALAGSWRITSLIASGGCGVVYAARHPILGRAAAVKVLHAELASSPGMVDRFVREARAVNQIRHPSIIDIFDFGELPDGRPFFVMELLAPRDLEHRIADAGRLGLAEVLAIMTPICLALEAAHSAGYIHRDLKARNIGFAVGAGGIEVPKLLDFGIAKLLEGDALGATGTVRVGTPHCMSPEQIRGERIDARTDIYALGVLLHHMLTGRCPFDGDSLAEIERCHLETPPPPPSRLAPVPPALDALVTRALAKRPADRPASVGALLAELAAVAPATGSHRRDAIAIRVVVDLPEPCDDRLVDDAAAAIDSAVARFTAAGFTPVVVTGTSVLAARVVDQAPDAAGSHARALAASLAASLDHALATRPRADPAIAARVAVHAAPLEVADDTGRFVGGPLLEDHTWPR
jgi:serine/threonine protein kinase